MAKKILKPDIDISPLTLDIMRAIDHHHPDVDKVMVSLMNVVMGTLVQFSKEDREDIRWWILDCLDTVEDVKPVNISALFKQRRA